MPWISRGGTWDSESPVQEEERDMRVEKTRRKEGTRIERVGPSLARRVKDRKKNAKYRTLTVKGDEREKGATRRRRPMRNYLARKVAPKVVEGVVCLMKSKIYNILGSITTERNAFKPKTIAVGTCSGYNLVRKAHLPPDWTRHTVREAPSPSLAGANSNPLKLTAVARLTVRVWNTTFRFPFVVADQQAVPVLPGTAFNDAHVWRIDVESQKLELRCGGSVAIVNAKGEPSPPTRPHVREKSR